MISVIVPVYNVEKYLPYCVASILGQTYGAFELILVDDGSSDGCPALVDGYAAADPRVKAIHRPNGGLSAARNTGRAAAQGEYIAFVDGDDILHPDYLKHLYESAAACHAQVAICRYVRIPESRLFRTGGKFPDPAKSFPLPEKLRWEPGPEGMPGVRCCTGREAVRLIVEDGQRYAIAACFKLFHRSVVPADSYPVGKLHEDEFTTYRMLYGSERVVVSGAAYYGYVTREGSITRQYRLEQLEAVTAMEGAAAFFRGEREDELACMAEKRLLLYLQAAWYHVYSSHKDRSDILAGLRARHRMWYEKNYPGWKAHYSLTDRLSLWIFLWSPRVYCLFGGVYQRLHAGD